MPDFQKMEIDQAEIMAVNAIRQYNKSKADWLSWQADRYDCAKKWIEKNIKKEEQ